MKNYFLPLLKIGSTEVYVSNRNLCDYACYLTACMFIR